MILSALNTRVGWWQVLRGHAVGLDRFHRLVPPLRSVRCFRFNRQDYRCQPIPSPSKDRGCRAHLNPSPPLPSLPSVRNPGRIPGACVLHVFVPVFPRYISNPEGRSRYQTSEFPITSEFPTELPYPHSPMLPSILAVANVEGVHNRTT